MIKDYVINNKTLMNEWDYEKNSAIGLFPDKLTCGSSKKAWWKCQKCGNEWMTRISHKNNGTKCKICNNIKLSTPTKDKSLQTLFSNVAKEWNYKKNLITPDCVYPQSNKKYWWICEKGHEWRATPTQRIGKNTSCPICSNHQVLIGYNDLATTNPELLAEWDYSKNDKKPTEITYGSKKPIYWVCKRGHHWKAVVYSRTTNKQGCPYCNKELRTSYPEKIISYYVNKLFPDSLENYRNPSLSRHELDIYIPSLNVGIEYDGSKWHQNINNDLIKDSLCDKMHIKLIRVREYGCPEYTSNSYKTYIHGKNMDELQNAVQQVLSILNSKSNIDVNLERDSSDILQNVISKEKEKSITKTNLINEWNWNKNKGINPETIPLFSNRKFWWICKNKHEWYASPAHRSKGRNCPYCAGYKVCVGYNDLASQYPQIAKEWDYLKNDKKPSEINAKTDKKYWWICSKCGHSWETSVYVRTKMHCNCPECKKKTISNHTSRKIRNIEKNITYDSIKKAALDLNVNESGISQCCRGISKTAGGYHWEYVNEKKARK